MERLSVPELSIEEVTAEAMRLLAVGLEELYVVLGCQLMGVARPAQVTGLIAHQSALRGLARISEAGGALPSLFAESKPAFDSLLAELKQDGKNLVAAVAQELADSLSSRELVELTHEITAASMQVVVVIVSAVLKLPREIEAMCATVAAIFCKAAMLEAAG